MGSWKVISDELSTDGASIGTEVSVSTIKDSSGRDQNIMELKISNTTVAILSDNTFIPGDTELHGYKDKFAKIHKGLTMNSDAGFLMHGKSTSSQYADVAERFHADEKMEAGTLVKIGGMNEITMTDRLGDPDIFGVVSKNPGVALNENAGNSDTHP